MFLNTISDRLLLLIALIVIAFLLLKITKEGYLKCTQEKNFTWKSYILNRWSLLIPFFVVVILLSRSFLGFLFQRMAWLLVQIATLEFRFHPLGSLALVVLSGAAVALILGAVYIAYKFWIAKSHWGAAVFVMLVLVFASFAYTGIPTAKTKLLEFYAYTAVDREALVDYIAKEKGLEEEEARFLVQRWEEKPLSLNQERIVVLFYVFVGVVTAGLVPLGIKFHRIGLVYLMRMFRIE